LAPQQARRAREPDELQDLIRRAYRTRRNQARLIVAECVERLPHYRDIPESLMADVRSSVVHHLELFYRVTLETGRPLTSDDLQRSRDTARLRASQGVPLGEFLTFFLVGLTAAWKHLTRNVGDDPILRARLLDRVEAIISNQTQLMTALTETYVEERERLSRFREQDLDEFFQLLPSEEVTENALTSRARALGIPLDEAGVVAIFAPIASSGREGVSIGPEDLRRELAGRMPQARLWTGRSPEGLAARLPQDADPEVLGAAAESLLGEDGRVGLGDAAGSIAGLRRSAAEAQRALRIGAMLHQAGRVHRYADLAVHDLVGVGSSDAEAFMRSVLGSLPTSTDGETYLETLRQLCANGYRIKDAAAALSVHPHTLSYRVKQIGRRFGVDLGDAQVRLRVQLALLILDAQG